MNPVRSDLCESGEELCVNPVRSDLCESCEE